jgi:chemotaxis protein methyltransferase CheR
MDDTLELTPVDQRLVDDLLQELYRQCGVDYRNYSRTFLSRRISAFVKKQNFNSVEEMVERVLEHDEDLEQFIGSLSLPTTRMFRDPQVFRYLRESVIPMLSGTHLTKIWSAGCSTGEEAYSLAIILHEELLGRKILTFATDLNEKSLYKAKKGIYQVRRMRTYTLGYMASGGTRDFSNYYTADDENAIFNEDIRKNIVFAQHNLVTDSTFNEFDLILCRNVLIYFNRELQERVVELLSKSLRPGGVLILGDKESLRSMSSQNDFVELDRMFRVFKKRE